MKEDFDLLNQQIYGQSQLQSQAGEQQERLYAPQMREQVAEAQAAIISQTNPAKALKIIIEGFRGNILNADGDWERLGNPIMNEYGISRIASILIPFISDPIRLGNVEERNIRQLVLQIAEDIAIEIGINWREYGIRDPSYKDLVLDSCVALIMITLSRSTGGDDKKWFGKVVVESISGNKLPQPKKEGVLEKYFKL